MAVGAVAGAGLIAAAGFLVFTGNEASEGFPLAAPDLAEQPELAWTLDIPAGSATKAENGLLIVSSGGYENDPAAYGVESDTGEVRWTQDDFGLSFEPGSVWCYVSLSELVACSAYGEERIAVFTLDPADGSRRWIAEYPNRSSNYMREVGDELYIANYDRNSRTVEVSRLAMDGTTEWTSTDNVATDNDDLYISAIGMSERHVFAELADELLHGFDRTSGQPVPWLMGESADDLSVKLVAGGAIRVDRSADGTFVERLDDDGAAIWSHQQAGRADACNEADYEHLYLCSDDGGSVAALDWETGAEAWTAGIAEGTTYAGETDDSVVLAGEGMLSVLDVASGQQRWQRQTSRLTGDGGWYTGTDLFPISESHVYAAAGVAGSGPTPTPAPGAANSAVVAYDLDEGAESWRLPVPELGDEFSVRLLVVDRQLLVINGAEWIAAVE